MDSQTSETTALLLAWADSDRRPLQVLTPRVYRERRRIAESLRLALAELMRQAAQGEVAHNDDTGMHSEAGAGLANAPQKRPNGSACR